MADRPVTERDLRMPEFRDVEPSDLEFRSDGKIVRKDRWEQAVFRVASLVHEVDPRFSIRHGFEIPDLLSRLGDLLQALVVVPTLEHLLEVLGRRWSDIALNYVAAVMRLHLAQYESREDWLGAVRRVGMRDYAERL
jgi:hypothetical protein